jgi:hypothetical protein
LIYIIFSEFEQNCDGRRTVPNEKKRVPHEVRQTVFGAVQVNEHL